MNFCVTRLSRDDIGHLRWGHAEMSPDVGELLFLYVVLGHESASQEVMLSYYLLK